MEQALKILNQRSDIIYAEPDYEIILYNVPNDTYFNQLWALNNLGQTGGLPGADIKALDAWDITSDAKDNIVAVIDTGVDYIHSDLANNIWINEAELNGDPCSDDDGNGYVDDIYGYDFSGYVPADQDSDPMDEYGHGTHVAGTIGAVGNNGTGVTGVCWNVKIMALRWLSAGGTGNISDAVKCIEYAEQWGADVMSNSWYNPDGYHQGLKDAIDSAGAAGVDDDGNGYVDE